MNTPTKYRKKPVVIEAMQVLYDLRNHVEIRRWAESTTPEGEEIPVSITAFDSQIVIHTLEGDMRATIGDWIIRGVQGEFYPCKPDIFAATYEAAVPGGEAHVPYAAKRAALQAVRATPATGFSWPHAIDVILTAALPLLTAAPSATREAETCAWCPSAARGSARHNDDRLYPSCGEVDHGQGWVPAQPAPSATRDEVADVVDGALIDAIYADTDMAVITQAADALLARFNITPKEHR